METFMKLAIALAVVGAVTECTAFGESAPQLLFDASVLNHKPSEVTTKDNTKVPAGTAELVEGKFGKALKLAFVESTGPQFFTAWAKPTEDWNQYDGFSFWVKGDGSKNCGGLEFIDGDDFRLRYGFCFPIASTEWTKISVAWSDLTPELDGPLVDAQHGFAPGKFRNVWFGKWFYWREYP